MRWSPAPYSLPITPRGLPIEIVDGEHFVTFDLLSLLAGHAPSTRDPEAEASHREQVSQASSISSISTRGDSSSTSLGPGQNERDIRPARLPLPIKGTSSTPRVSQIGKKGTGRVKSTPGAQVEDFIPWVCPEPNRSSALEEKEKEEEMTGLLNRYASRKRKR